jgi:hypothetical protein
MCDYSLHNVKSRPAKVGDKLTTRSFGTGTRGFSASEMQTLRSVCFQERSYLFLARLPVSRLVYSVGAIK